MICKLLNLTLIATALLVLSANAQETEPTQLLSFGLNLNDGFIRMDFNIPVDVSSCNPTGITLQNELGSEPSDSLTLTGGVCSAVNPTSVNVILTTIDWEAIIDNSELATGVETTYLALGSFIRSSGDDAAENLPIPPESPLRASFVIPPSVYFSINSVSLDLDVGTLQMSFTKSVVITEPSLITFSSGNFNYTLTGGAFQSMAPNNTHEMIILLMDLNSLKIAFGSSVNASLWKVTIQANATFSGEVGNNFTEIGLTSLIPDITRPRIVAFSLDMDIGTITLLFDEPINPVTQNLSYVYIVGGTSPSFNTSYSLTGSFGTAFGSIVDKYISFDTLSQLKIDQQVATNIANTFIYAEPDAFSDYNNNLLLSISKFAPLTVSIFTRDSTHPIIITFEISLKLSTMTLSFDEPINKESFDPSTITVFDGTQTDSSYTFNSSVNVSFAAYQTEVILSLGTEELNKLQQIIFNSQPSTIYMNSTFATCFDTNGNIAFPALWLQMGNDVWSPTLVSYAPVQRPPQNYSMKFTFNEDVDENSFDISSITLTLINPVTGSHTYSSFSGGNVTYDGESNVTYHFSNSDLSGLFPILYQIAYYHGNMTITFTPNLVTDLEGNKVQVKTRPEPLIYTSMEEYSPVLIENEDQCYIPTQTQIFNLLNPFMNTSEYLTQHKFSCLAAGKMIDTYRSASVVAFIDSTDVQVTCQFELKCQNSTWKIIPSLREVPLHHFENVIPRYNCSYCSAVNDFACVACPDNCTNGIQRCISPTECCPFYNANGECTHSCAFNETVDDRYTCGVSGGCPSENDTTAWNILWPGAAPNTTQFQSCPGQNSIGSASRYCGSTGVWLPANFSQCQTESFVNIQSMADDVFSQPIDQLTPTELVNVATQANVLVDELSVVTNSSVANNVPLFPSDLSTTNDVLSNTINVLNASLVANNFKAAVNETAIVDVLNNVLDSINVPGWLELQADNPAMGSELLLINTEKFGAYLVQSTSKPDGELLSRRNIVLRAQLFDVETIDSTADLTFPSDSDLVNFSRPDSTNTPATITIPNTLLLERAADNTNSLNGVPVVYTIFNNLQELLKDPTINETIQPGTVILSSQVGLSRSDTSSPALLDNPISISFSVLHQNFSSPSCVFWEFSIPIGKGSWSEANIDTDTSDFPVIKCLTDHLTSFAVLVDVTGYTSNIPEYRALSIVTYIGLTISVICLIATIIFFIVLPIYQRKFVVLNFVHLNLSVCLLLAYIVFMSGIETAVGDKVACTIVAAILHYLFLSVFFWMLSEGVMLYLMLVVVFSKLAKRWWFFFLLGWVPAIFPVAITVGITHDTYVNETQFCWLSSSSHVIWSFVVPMIIIVIINTIFLVMVIVNIVKNRKNRPAKKLKGEKRVDLVITAIKASVILLPLLGLTWVIGLFAINENTTVFAWLFVLCNAFQGVAIFFFHVIRNELVWNFIMKLFRKYITKDYTDTSTTNRSSSKLRKGTIETKTLSTSVVSGDYDKSEQPAYELSSVVISEEKKMLPSEDEIVAPVVRFEEEVTLITTEEKEMLPYEDEVVAPVVQFSEEEVTLISTEITEEREMLPPEDAPVEEVTLISCSTETTEEKQILPSNDVVQFEEEATLISTETAEEREMLPPEDEIIPIVQFEEISLISVETADDKASEHELLAPPVQFEEEVTLISTEEKEMLPPEDGNIDLITETVAIPVIQYEEVTVISTEEKMLLSEDEIVVAQVIQYEETTS